MYLEPDEIWESCFLCNHSILSIRRRPSVHNLYAMKN